jgi:ABC-2 type transport system ATP-binding protein
VINAQSLCKKYAGKLVVEDLSLSVLKGQIVGFLGPNGAGKTSTLRMLACFVPPTSGTAAVAGFDVVEQPLEVKRRIGYLPEQPPLYLDMDSLEFLSFVGRLHGLSGATLTKRVDEVCDRCGIGEVRKKLLGKLSKGYRQRVGLAQAILHDPEVLLLDEPTAGLDPNQIHETREVIRSLGGDHTVLLSTHILSEVEQTCEQALIINQGKLVAADSVQNLRARGPKAPASLEEVFRQLTLGEGAFPVTQRAQGV